MSTMTFSDLFKSTLNMFKLDPEKAGSLSAKHIKSVFDQVLKAEELCYADFVKTPPSKYEHF
ncbi:MAG: hypothetical protein PVH02_13350 [Desulfobacteraceae bacterium]